MKKTIKIALAGIIFQLLSINSFSQWIEWERLHNFDTWTQVFSVKQATDRNFVISGSKYFTGGFVCKVGNEGNILWNQDSAAGYSIVEIDNSFYSIYNKYIYKVSNNGSVIWRKEIPEAAILKLYNMRKMNSNDILVAGEAGNNGYVAKIDINGNKIWSREFSQNQNVSISSAREIAGGKIIVIGSSHSGNQIFLSLINSTGSIKWQKSFGTQLPDNGVSAFQTNDGGLFCISTVSYNTWNQKYYISKTDLDGNLQWSKIIGDTNTFYFYSYGDCAVYDQLSNQYVITSRILDNTHNYAGAHIFALDSNANIAWSKTSRNDTMDYDPFSVDICSDSTFVIAGDGFDLPLLDSDPRHLYILKTKKINPIGISSISSEIPGRFILHQNYPNPFNPVTKIKFELPKSSVFELNVYDILGRKVYTAYYNKPAGTYEFDFDASGFASGIYFYSVKAGEYSDTKKMIIVK